jgi:hypothetical protein
MQASERLAELDQRFVDIYEAARARIVERQKQIALIVIQDDDLLLYRHERPMERFPGLIPPLYNKMKTLGHIPLGIFSLLHDRTYEQLSESVLVQVAAYRAAIEAAAGALDTHEEAKAGILPKPSQVYPKVTAFLGAVLAKGRVSEHELDAFARSIGEDIPPLLAAAARAQFGACNTLVTEIRKKLLTKEQWDELHVLVLGPYMAKQGELFLQYFAEVLHTHQQGDWRVVYFDGDDLPSAFDRLGTTMLDALGSKAIFGKRARLHRDVLADATTEYLKSLTAI